MQSVRSRTIVAVVVAAAVFAVWPSRAQTQDSSLSLNPSSGDPSVSFTADFQYTAARGSGNGNCPPEGATINFSWDGSALGQSALGQPHCSGSITATPPAGLDAIGNHTVCGAFVDTTSHSACNTYAVTAPPSPTPSPTPSPSISPSPAPTRPPPVTPTPHPTTSVSGARKTKGSSSPSPSSATSSPTVLPSEPLPPLFSDTPAPSVVAKPPSCTLSLVPRATSGFGYLGIPGLPGAAKDPAHPEWIDLTTVLPASMLPPNIGHADLVSLQITKKPDRSSPELKAVLNNETPLVCAYVALGPSKDFHFASFALEEPRITSFELVESADSVQTEKVTISYARANWEYQIAPGGAVITGHGVSAHTTGSNRKPLFVAVVGVLGLAAVSFLLMNRNRRRV